jgi:spermidine/putrescine transport system ATP-binding protein
LNTNKEKNLTIQNVVKTFGKVEVLKTVNQVVKAGEFFTLLGPSGCGKTTLLRIIAGLEIPTTGSIILGNDDITSLPATKRHVNMVFQSYALFPHLTIYENIAFGLRSRKINADDIKRRVSEGLEMLRLEALQDRMPDQLSGGQKQRVSLARALVNEPDILLLDEPMSALDAKLRSQVQEDLRRLQRKLGTTFIMVTHDQDEALVCSDRIAVMNGGVIVQCGTPEEVYDYPCNKFVAEFLGAANMLKAKRVDGGVETEIGYLSLEKMPDWSEGLVTIRPEWIKIRENKPERNGVLATVDDVVYRGTNFDLFLSPGNLRVRTSANKNFRAGDKIWLELTASDLVALGD